MYIKLLVAFLLIQLARADLRTHKYKKGEEVTLWANKVWPLNNPQEIYPYFSLPFCKEQDNDRHYDGLGARLQGYDLRETPVKIQFDVGVPDVTEICTLKLDENNYKKMIKAVKRDFWYQLFLDDLPVWGKVGEIVNKRAYIRAHSTFVIHYNKDQIVMVELIMDKAVEVSLDTEVSFTYKVIWKESTVAFENRFDSYLEDDFFEHQIHWFSIYNSFLLVLFMEGIVAMILSRAIKKDLKVNLDTDPLGESGWKLLHGDVFRPPSHLMLLSAMVGSGYQLTAAVIGGIAIAQLGDLYEDRGSQVTAFVICYGLFSILAGYGSGAFYARNQGRHWIRCALLTAAFFPLLCFFFSFLLLTVPPTFSSAAAGSIPAVPPGSLGTLFMAWLAIDVPLTILGTIFGRHYGGNIANPTRNAPRWAPAPTKPKHWYADPVASTLLGGILPFASIFIEIYFIFSSFWHYKYYYVYGALFLVFLILVLVTMCSSVVMTYLVLNSEDYRWHWVSFMSGASCSFYVYLYAIYYFFSKTAMTGLLQISIYFGYMAMFCLALFLVTGAMGFASSQFFVFIIYRYLKLD